MVKKKRSPNTTPELRKEIAEAYRDHPELSIQEIGEMFGVHKSTIYRSVNQVGVTRKTGWAEGASVRQETLAVKVDSQDTVQSVKPEVMPRAFRDTWVVRYTAETTVEAESIDLAIAAVRKLGTAKRIYSVRLKS